MQEIALQDGVTEKRGRGRPPKSGSMTNAQRQAAFRARRKAAGESVTVTKNIPAAGDGYDDLVLENDRLREELAQARRELGEQRQAFREPVGKKWSYRQITALAEREIRHQMGEASKAASKGEANMSMLCRGYANSILLFWYLLTVGWQNDGDNGRLEALLKHDVTRNEK
ncbi:hypothetical protein [Trinickia dinghuensis]|uniref:Uncharacterized protein n=1 Tax=Trinickia dinghuensis TaxID=2291023 RepID=A0A3D8JV51_9BURK|nr:hypothetical protein [Trinickia dinghuensis]RDU96672.1 hypothetical protein DWV00_21975 [Trinickia dinghuensis]